MRKIGVGLAVALAVGCGGESKKAEDTANQEQQQQNEKTAKVGTLALSGLNLDKSIDPNIPTNVIDSGAASLRGANLLDGGKSLERCLLQQSISEFKTNVAMVKMQLCSLTSMAGLEWGKAYNIDMSGMGGGGMPLTQGDIPPPGGDIPPPGGDMPPPGGDMPPGGDGPGGAGPGGGPGGAPGGDGPGGGGDMPGMPKSMQVKMDNSVAGEYTIYLCADKVLQQKIKVKGATDTGATGSYAVKMDLGSDNVMELRGTFDNGVTTAGRYQGMTQMRFSMGGMKMNSGIKLDLGSGASDVHFVQSSREQASSFADLTSSTKELMAGRFGPDFGSAIVQRTGGNDSIFGLMEGGPETARAFFSVDGNNVEESASAAFAEGGAYHMKADDLPKLPDPSETWAIEGWDCATGLEELAAPTVDQGGAPQQQNTCFESSPFADMEFACFGGGFAPGEPVQGAPDVTANRDDGDIFELPPPPPGDQVPPADGDTPTSNDPAVPPPTE